MAKTEMVNDIAVDCPESEHPLLFALKELYLHTQYLEDSGPDGEGWQSTSFMAALARAKALLEGMGVEMD